MDYMYTIPHQTRHLLACGKVVRKAWHNDQGQLIGVTYESHTVKLRTSTAHVLLKGIQATEGWPSTLASLSSYLPPASRNSQR